MISSAFAINTFNEEKDPITQAYGEKPSQEKILELPKSKGYTRKVKIRTRINRFLPKGISLD